MPGKSRCSERTIRSRLEGCQSPVRRILENARIRAGEEYSRILEEADMKAAESLKCGREQLEAEQKKAMEQLKSRIAETALCAAEKAAGSGRGELADLAAMIVYRGSR